MVTNEGRIEKLLKRADAAMQDGIKKADRVLDEAVSIGTITARQAARASREMHTRVTREREELKSRSMKGISGGISAARRMASGERDDLEVLEKLGKLRKSKVITEKEFQEKKRKILARI